MLLLLFGAIALALRVGVSYYAVFGRDFVAFIESDAWYHMRLVDATVRHFPHRIWFDPYLVWPGGEWVNAGPFFDWVIAGAALLIGLGSPSARLVDVVGAYAPAVIGALTGIPVYVIGRELFSRRAGLWAAFIVGVLPGQILMRSALGFTDHHCAETLLSTTAVMWIVLALDSARPLRQRLRLSGGAGATFGCYLLTWGGGSLFVLVVVASSAASLILQRLRRETSDNLPLILAPAFAVAAVMIAPWFGTRPYFGYDLAALAGGAALLIGLRAWGVVTTSLRHDRLVYLSGLAAGAGLCLLVAFVRHDGWSGLAAEIGRISPWRAAGYVREAAPLLKAEEQLSAPALERVCLEPVACRAGRSVVRAPAGSDHVGAWRAAADVDWCNGRRDVWTGTLRILPGRERRLVRGIRRGRTAVLERRVPMAGTPGRQQSCVDRASLLAVAATGRRRTEKGLGQGGQHLFGLV